jgi:tetratricopeptide (TPR) repeat protein
MIRHTLKLILAVLSILVSSEYVFSQSSLQNQGMILYEQGNLSEAVDMLNRADQSEILLPESYLIYISASLQIGDAISGELNSKKALDLYPDLKAFKWLLAESYLLQNETDLALPIYKSLYDALSRGETLQPMQVGLSQAKIRLGQLYQFRAGRARMEDDNSEAIRFLNEALHFIPDSVQVYKNLSVLLLEENRTEELLSHLESARERFPEDSDLIRLQASAFYKLDNREELLERFKEIHQLDPENIDDGLIYAELLMASQNSGAAYEVLEKLLEHDSRDKRIYEHMIQIHESRFSTKGKRLVLKKMETIFPVDLTISERIAETYEFENDWANARSVYDSLLVVSDNDISYKLKIAGTYEMENRLGEAENILQNLSDTRPETPDVHRRLGKNLVMQQKWHLAVEPFKKWVTLQPENTDAYISLGTALYHSNNGNEAKKTLLTALDMGARDPMMYLTLSKIDFTQNKKADALQYATNAIQFALREMEYKQQEVQQTIENEGMLSRYDSRTDADELTELNELASDSFDWLTSQFSHAAVGPVLDNLLEDYPVSGKLRVMTGVYYYSLNDTSLALNILEEAVRFSPKEMDAHFIIGEILKQTEKLDEAKASYQRAQAIDPENERIYSALIDIHSRMGNLDQLCDQWMAAYRAKKDNLVLKEHLIEALHKANRFEEARQILSSSE